MIEVVEYLDAAGSSPFARWLESVESRAAAKVVTATVRIGHGNLSNVKTVGKGVLEFRIDYGPGYRIYFGRDGDTLVILLGGGTKDRQQRDIDLAHERWADYKQRKG